MKERIFEHWISSTIGIALILGSAAAVWFGKISVDNFLLVLPVAAGFIISKDKIIGIQSKDNE